MKKNTDILLIAPCGINCSLCGAFQRSKKKCDGCNVDSKNKPKHCYNCSIKNCEGIKKEIEPFCFKCDKFPCTRMKLFDKRYRSKYGMSTLENLNNIKEKGLAHFCAKDKKKWKCSSCGELLCVHAESCLKCGHENKLFPGNKK